MRSGTTPAIPKNRDRLLEHAVVESFFTEVMTLADKRHLLSREHFSVDSTLIQAWASHKSFVRKDGISDRAHDDANSGGPSGRNTQADWKGKPRSNDTHASTTDPDARLFRKSHYSAAILSYQGHVLMENRSGLVVGAVVTHADGLGERAAALAMLDRVPGKHSKTVAADKAYDTRDFIAACRQRRITPHVASNDTRIGGSAIDGRTTRHSGYAVSQTIRKRIGEHFGWGKTVGRVRQRRKPARVEVIGQLGVAKFNSLLVESLHLQGQTVVGMEPGGATAVQHKFSRPG